MSQTNKEPSLVRSKTRRGPSKMPRPVWGGKNTFRCSVAVRTSQIRTVLSRPNVTALLPSADTIKPATAPTWPIAVSLLFSVSACCGWRRRTVPRRATAPSGSGSPKRSVRGFASLTGPIPSVGATDSDSTHANNNSPRPPANRESEYRIGSWLLTPSARAAGTQSVEVPPKNAESRACCLEFLYRFVRDRCFVEVKPLQTLNFFQLFKPCVRDLSG